MTVLAAKPKATTGRWAFEWFIILLTATIVAHGLGCHEHEDVEPCVITDVSSSADS